MPFSIPKNINITNYSQSLPQYTRRCPLSSPHAPLLRLHGHGRQKVDHGQPEEIEYLFRLRSSTVSALIGGTGAGVGASLRSRATERTTCVPVPSPLSSVAQVLEWAHRSDPVPPKGPLKYDAAAQSALRATSVAVF